MNHPYMSVVAPAFIAIPIGVALAKYKVAPREVKILFYFLLVTVVIYLVSTLLALNKISNTAVIHADTVIEALFLLTFFYTIFPHPAARKYILFLVAGFTVFCCINFIFIQGPGHYNSYSRPVEAIIFIALSMFYFWNSGNEAPAGNWTDAPLNWVVSGVLLYFSSAFFLFIFSNLVVSKYNLSINELVWNIHATLVVIMYLLFAIGFSKYKT